MASLSSHYLQIKNAGEVDPKTKKEIENWLNNIAMQVRKDYETYPDNPSRNNNHMYWAAWSVMITGIATNNKSDYRWARKQYKKAIRQIEPDGTLPLELFRQSKAFHYHIFAVTPLIMMAETMLANDNKLYDYKEGRLHKLVELILSEMNNEQAYFREKTGRTQNLKGSITPENLAWLEIYNKNYPDERSDRWLKKLRPMVQRRTGGNLTLMITDNDKDAP